MEKVLKDKKIIVGVTGGIAAYKAADLVSKLKQQGSDVHVLMSKCAKKFIGETTLAALSGNKVLDRVFDKNPSINHIDCVTDADLFVIVPATANTIARIRLGLSEHIIETAWLVAKCPKLVCPAMNENMWNADIVQSHIKNLKNLGVNVLEPDSGYLACGKYGSGRLPDSFKIIDKIESIISGEIENDNIVDFDDNSGIKGKKVLITAGPTREYLDDVRYLTNESSGRMGFEIYELLKKMGAKVEVISGKCEYFNSYNSVQIKTGAEMLDAVKKNYYWADIVICAAAVGDLGFIKKDGKLKKNQLSYCLNDAYLNKDILAWCGENKRFEQIVVGFALESDDIAANARDKLKSKNIDVIFANKVGDLGTDHISPIIINKNEQIMVEKNEINKKEAAKLLIDAILGMK